jgi:sirohydrochlorin cobaltochelatase
LQKSFSPYIFIHFLENCHTADRFRHSVKKEDKNMKNKTVKALALLMTVTTVSMMGASSIYASDTETTTEAAAEETEAAGEESADADQQAADNVAALIDKIYVQERTETTDDDCKAAKEAWDALTDAQKELVEGENASPDYFGLDTGDAAKDDARNADEIGENELLVVSFGTSYNDSRVEDIKGIEDALQEAYPDWAVRRAFTAQIIINHVQARDGEVIDNMQQALDRAVENGVKNLVVQPTHLMHGAEYDEMAEVLEQYQDKFESVAIAEPMLGEVGDDATVINEDKAAVAQAVADAAVQEAGFDSMEAAAEDGTAFVFLGHGTSHTAKVSYSQMQTQMEELGFKNAFIGTVEGEPEDTACEAVIEKVKEAGYKKVILRPLMVVAGDHANNDMAGSEEDSWKSMFEASGSFDSVDAQIAGLGRIDAVKQLYVDHTKAAIDSLGTEAATEDEAAEAETAEAETEAAEE